MFSVMIRLQRNPGTIQLRFGDKNKFGSDAHACHHPRLCLPLALFSVSGGFLLLFISTQRFPQRDLAGEFLTILVQLIASTTMTTAGIWNERTRLPETSGNDRAIQHQHQHQRDS